MKFAGWYATVAGVLIFIHWGFFLFTANVPELETMPFQISAHLAAEFATAIVLIGSGLAVLKNRAWAPKAYFVASGMLIYTVINSGGHFAQLGKWTFVVVFGVLLILTVIGLGKMVRTTSA